MKGVSRRNFIKVSATATGGMMLAFNLPAAAGFLTEEAIEGTQLNSYLKIDKEGNIIFNLTKHEMGQGSGTGLPMILADELGADWNKLSIVRSDYDTSFSGLEMGTTGGSSTIYKMWDVLRNAGATAREMLKQAAADEWGTGPEQLQVANSYVINPITGDQLEFGQLVGKAATLPVPEEVTLKAHADFELITKPVKNLITQDVTMGKANYGINIDIPNMVYASIEKCPVYKGKMKSFDAEEALKVFGVIDVIPFPSIEAAEDGQHVQEGVAVIAKSTWSALKGRKALKIEWDFGKNGNQSIDELNATIDAEKEKSLEVVYSKGNLAALEEDEDVEWMEYDYANPYQAHALMEPINGTAHFQGDSCEVWVGTQSGERMSKEVEKITGLPREKVTIHVLNSGGSFGRRYYADSTMEATYLSQAIGKPVKVTWSREDEISHDYFHPYQRSIHKAAVKDDKVLGWSTKIFRTENYFSGDNPWEIPYDFPNVTTYTKEIESIIHTGAWRSVSEHSSSLGRESFMDELALKVNMDPISFRLSLLNDDIVKEGNDDFAERVFQYRKLLRTRFKAVLNTVKEKGLMSAPRKPGTGRGIAIDTFSRTVVAHVVDVSLNNSRVGFQVDKVSSVVHCGTLVNPHFGRGQIEGSIIWALSAVYYGGVEVNDGIVNRSNFHDNILLRIDETPEIDVHFIPSEEPPTGLGEPATPPLAPAVLNALYDATGNRIRKIPVSKADLKIAEREPVA